MDHRAAPRGSRPWDGARHGTLISNHPHWHCHLNSTCALNVGIHRRPPILFLCVDRGWVQVSSCLQI